MGLPYKTSALAPIAQWQCNALVMRRYLVSTGWGHHKIEVTGINSILK